MRWCLDCQTCQKAKCYQYGVCFPCNDDECHYTPFQNTVSSQSVYIKGQQTISNNTNSILTIENNYEQLKNNN